MRNDIKRWVNVDKFQPSLRFNLFPHGTILERRKDEFVVSPNEFIRPIFYLPARGVKKLHLCLSYLLASWLVNMFNCLEWQNSVCYFIGLSIPHKFNFPIIIKKQKSVFLRQWFARFQILQYIPLFAV